MRPFATRNAVQSGRSDGFTLVELILTLAIVAVLAATAIPLYHQMKDEQSAGVANREPGPGTDPDGAGAGFAARDQLAPQDESWPRAFIVDGTEITLYEPRIEKWQGSSLDVRFGAVIGLKHSSKAVHGSFAAHADAVSNTETRMVTLFNFSVSEVKFPDALDKVAEFARIISALEPEKPLRVSLDALLAAVPSEDIITGTTVTTPTQTKAPKIVVSFQDSVLVAFDGSPVFRGIPGTGLEAAVNTPATVLRPANGGPLYLLTNEGLWLQAPGIAGPWSVARTLPQGLDRIPADHPVAWAVKNAWASAGAVAGVPRVITSVTPTEIIQIDGEPKFDRIADLSLERVSNTDAPLFYHFDQQVYYVLISGRWFVSRELTGPWTYLSHTELPGDFARIPSDDPAADVRASVAGTREAEEAAKEAQIPNYATVDLREAPAITVEYDGEPVFEEVPGTGAAYATNTTDAVLLASGRYYCCRDGLWFVAEAAWGSPWQCATMLPPAIGALPPACPLYYTTFCAVDRCDGGFVVYRCTAGYWGTYIDPFSHVCVYGTGWTYLAYVSQDYYCGRSWTYGLGCRYAPRRGFVRACDRVAHTSWFRYTGRGSALCRADSDLWGGRFAGTRWHGSSGRSLAYSNWSNRVATHSDEVAKIIQRGTPSKPNVAHGSVPKPKVVVSKPTVSGSKSMVVATHHAAVGPKPVVGSKPTVTAIASTVDAIRPAVVTPKPTVVAHKPIMVAARPAFESRDRAEVHPVAQFDKDVRAGREGEVHHQGAEGGPRRESGQWRQPDQGNPADPRVALVTPKPHFEKQNDAPRSERVDRQYPVEPFHSESSRAEHREASTQTQRQAGAQIQQFDRRAATAVQPRESPQMVKRHEASVQMQQQVEPQVPQVERHVPPGGQRREMPRVVEHQNPPPQIQQQVVPQVQQQFAPQLSKNNRNDLPVVQHREVPQVVERYNPPPQPQLRHEEPRRVEPPQPVRGSAAPDSRSPRSDDKRKR